MGCVADAVKQLRQESKYIHVMSRAHKTLDESSLPLIFSFQLEIISFPI